VRFFSELPGFMEGFNQLEQIDTVIKMSEKYDFTGSLIFYHHSSLDPWLLASRLLQNTERLKPLIATQPYSIPPFSAAKVISSISNLYNRKVSLNLITGVSELELLSVNQTIDPKAKYARLKEYIEIVMSLLTSPTPLDYSGEYYSFQKLKLAPIMNQDNIPELFIPGSSQESIRVACEYADTALLRPEPLPLFSQNYCKQVDPRKINLAIRLSVIARPTAEEAWRIAEEAFPFNKMGKVITRIRKKMRSHNTRLMAELATRQELYDDVYWMGAYMNGLTEDPILVGSYNDVASYLKGYFDCGVNTFLFGHLRNELQFECIAEVKKILETLTASETMTI
jgi:alkanesulfonate monooxygenase